MNAALHKWCRLNQMPRVTPSSGCTAVAYMRVLRLTNSRLFFFFLLLLLLFSFFFSSSQFNQSAKSLSLTVSSSTSTGGGSGWCCCHPSAVWQQLRQCWIQSLSQKKRRHRRLYFPRNIHHPEYFFCFWTWFQAGFLFIFAFSVRAP